MGLGRSPRLEIPFGTCGGGGPRPARGWSAHQSVSGDPAAAPPFPVQLRFVGVGGDESPRSWPTPTPDGGDQGPAPGHIMTQNPHGASYLYGRQDRLNCLTKVGRKGWACGRLRPWDTQRSPPWASATWTASSPGSTSRPPSASGPQ